ncbi:MAG: hypothetical protein POELPBGB_00693 [Bacteroidia bacterium]|nr:hypothetical protein [Bacteroidia bacterium]
MKNRIILLLLTANCLLPTVHAQNKAAFDYYNLRNKKSQRAMHITLASWSVANFATSLALMDNRNAPYNKYFYHMNIYWNVVNATIAGFGLANVYRKDPIAIGFNNYDLLTLSNGQQKIERLMLMNSFLDVLYIGSGMAMDYYSPRLKKNPDLLDGYGKSMVFQGAFLLLFDTSFYLIYKSNYKHFSKMSYSMSATPYGVGFKMVF